jgi:hypothetical protein
MKFFIAALVSMALTSAAIAQQHTASVQPQYRQPGYNAGPPRSAYDPFQLDWTTGRFRYVPTPYEGSPGAGYDPYQFNP